MNSCFKTLSSLPVDNSKKIKCTYLSFGGKFTEKGKVDYAVSVFQHIRGEIVNNLKIFISRKVFEPYFSTTSKIYYHDPWSYLVMFLYRYHQMGVHSRMLDN